MFPSPELGSSKTLSSVDRALSLLEILAREGKLNLTELAKELGASKPTTFRLAMSLIARGWVFKDEELNYQLGAAALSVMAQNDPLRDIKAHLLPVLMELNTETQETVHLTRLEGRYVVYLHQLASTKSVVSLAHLDARSPAHCVSPGLAFLAALPPTRLEWVLMAPLVRYTDLTPTTVEAIRDEIARTRERGYGVNFGAYRKDVGGVGVVVLDRNNDPFVGISICIPVFRLKEIDIDALGKRLLRAAADASALLS